LNGLIYRDDRQITDSAVRMTSINGAFIVRGMPRILLEGFARGQEFVYVKIESAPDHRELLR
jgi:crossover junction endodeoxyribonuclease RusA